MLKKAGYTLIMLLLLFGTTGVTITRHYCGQDLTHIALYSTPDNCCGAQCPRCHNEKISFRITDNFEASQITVDFHSRFTILLEKHSLPLILNPFEATNILLCAYAPGGHAIKPVPKIIPLQAGLSSAFLQVFLV
jgi:hypothetical protein